MDQAQLLLEMEKMQNQRNQWEKDHDQRWQQWEESQEQHRHQWKEDHEQRWHQWEKSYSQRNWLWAAANIIAVAALALKLYMG